MSAVLARDRPLLQTRAPLRLLPDAQLASLVARGNDLAFAVIFERYRPRLERYCRSILLNVDDAGDAVQSAMAAAFSALRRGDREIALRPWLYRVAHNEAITILRGRGRGREVELDEADLPLTRTLEEDADERQELRQLVSDLQALPARQSAALVLRELDGLSYDDIGAMFGTSPIAARQAVFAARAALCDLGDGRDEPCESVRTRLSEGRRARGRRVHAHLRACGDCRGYKLALDQRRRALALLFPADPAGLWLAFKGLLVSGGLAGARLSETIGRATGIAPSPGALRTAAATVAAVAVVGAGAAQTVNSQRSPTPRATIAARGSGADGSASSAGATAAEAAARAAAQARAAAGSGGARSAALAAVRRRDGATARIVAVVYAPRATVEPRPVVGPAAAVAPAADAPAAPGRISTPASPSPPPAAAQSPANPIQRMLAIAQRYASLGAGAQGPTAADAGVSSGAAIPATAAVAAPGGVSLATGATGGAGEAGEAGGTVAAAGTSLLSAAAQAAAAFQQQLHRALSVIGAGSPAPTSR